MKPYASCCARCLRRLGAPGSGRACTGRPGGGCGRGHCSGSPPCRSTRLALSTTRSGTGVSAVAGRMAYELTGSACEGYTQTMRFVTRMTNQSGNTVVTDLRSSTWEEGGGKRFRFDSSQYRDDKATEATVGEAARRNPSEDVKVELTKPAKKNLSISSRVYFPIQHTIALLTAAKAAKAVLPRRSLRRFGKRRKDLRHRGRSRPCAGTGRQPQAAAGEECRAARRAQGLAGVHRLFRAGV